MELAASLLTTALCAVLPLTAIATSGGVSHSAAPANAPSAHAAPAARSASAGSEPRTSPADHQPVRPPSAPRVQPLPPHQEPTQVNPPSNGHPILNPDYWGDGFWGPLQYGLDAASYIVDLRSPGARLLQAYDLTETPCGPPNLIEIFGPSGSEICAFPNGLVAPGQYYVDPDTLTIYSGPPREQ